MVRGGGRRAESAAAQAPSPAVGSDDPAAPSRGSGGGQRPRGVTNVDRGRSRGTRAAAAPKANPPRRREHAHSRDHRSAAAAAAAEPSRPDGARGRRPAPARPAHERLARAEASRGSGGGHRPAPAPPARERPAPVEASRGSGGGQRPRAASPSRNRGRANRAMHEPLLRPENRDDEEEDTDCFGCCCTLIVFVFGVLYCLIATFCCFCCCRSSEEDSDEEDRSVPRPAALRSLPRDNIRRGPSRMGIYAATTLMTLLWIIGSLMAFTWTGSSAAATILDFSLTAGETRHVESPNYVSSFLNSFTITADPSIDTGAEVYQTSTKVCPPLTGRPQVIQNPETIPMAYGNFEYDYFFLNAGSSIALSISLDYGLANVYILRGMEILKSIKGETTNDPNFGHWDEFLRQNSLRSLSLDKYTRSANLSYRVGGRQDIDDDVYILLYDNIHNDESQIQVRPKITATTHSLPLTPVCNMQTTASVYGCDWRRDASGRRSISTLDSSCIVVKAVSTSAYTDFNDVVTLHVTVTRRWGLFIGILSFPFAMIVFVLTVRYAILSIYACCCQRSSSGRRDEENPADELHEPLFPDIPPATAPGYVPTATAPVEEVVEAQAVLVNDSLEPLGPPAAASGGKS